MFNNDKCNYATIIFGDRVIKGYCKYWSIQNGGSMIKLIVEDVQYVTDLKNVLLEQRDETTKND